MRGPIHGKCRAESGWQNGSGKMCWKRKEKGIGLSVGSGCEIGEVGESECWKENQNGNIETRRD